MTETVKCACEKCECENCECGCNATTTTTTTTTTMPTRVYVVGVDATETSVKLTRWMSREVARPGDEVRLVHVIPGYVFLLFFLHVVSSHSFVHSHQNV